MLSSQAILKGILTDQSGAELAAGTAMYTYFMRDLSGMIGGIVFATLQVILGCSLKSRSPFLYHQSPASLSFTIGPRVGLNYLSSSLCP